MLTPSHFLKTGFGCLVDHFTNHIPQMAGKPKPMSQIKQLLRLHQQGEGKKTIARKLGMSKNTVKAYLDKLAVLPLSIEVLLALEDPVLESKFHAGPNLPCWLSRAGLSKTASKEVYPTRKSRAKTHLLNGSMNFRENLLDTYRSKVVNS